MSEAKLGPVAAKDGQALRDTVAALIRGRIKGNKYPVGCLLPARPLLVAELGVSRSTVDSACRVLRNEGYLVSIPGRGRGTVVLDPLNPPTGPEVPVRRSEGHSETWYRPDANRDTVERIKAAIRNRIADGTYPPRQRIPSVARIVEEFTTSTSLARAALEVLKEEGTVYSRTPGGHFVSPPAEGVDKDRKEPYRARNPLGVG